LAGYAPEVIGLDAVEPKISMDSLEAQLRGVPVSQSNTDRRARPKINAALSPAGPPPAMTTS
jgi:hypothetical protein